MSENELDELEDADCVQNNATSRDSRMKACLYYEHHYVRNHRIYSDPPRKYEVDDDDKADCERKNAVPIH
jgi:hypothetical protein